ncbi:site-specific integrase [uncultured Brachybacterium sp.]|uniref:site-specific integrase n=1 Tax=uncultured Brachybacterium sp. TaxID=189680 RepID=UPI002610B4E7|nr:site-specific integrase [uncultured Brachybacterium sp.]
MNLLRRRIAVTRAVRYIRGTGFKVGDTKGKGDRTVPVPAFLATMLKDAVAGAAGPDALIFPAPRAEYLRQPGKSRVVDGKRAGVKWWERALDAAGVEWMTPHDLRHTASSLAVSAGANVKAVQQMLAHKSASLTLETYADLFDSDLDDVAVRMDAQRGHALGTTREERWGTELDSQGMLGIVRGTDPVRG